MTSVGTGPVRLVVAAFLKGFKVSRTRHGSAVHRLRRPSRLWGLRPTQAGSPGNQSQR